MTGIPPEKVVPKLSWDPSIPPIRQRKRPIVEARNKFVNEEVTRLLDIGSIREVKYPDWIADIIVVPKKRNKYCMCVDFKDLNKAFPKDSFPLPNIDQMIDTKAEYLMSLLDAYSRYNQIKMNPEDQEKTSFIMNFGIYCYNMMPFGLKNARATYQQLVNKMFEKQIRKTMEVYIDDMLVKSLNAGDHLKHLQESFDILRKHNMKLNPEKCTFGVSSYMFLGFLVSQRVIEVNPDRIKAIEDIPDQLSSAKEVQRLTWRLAALNRLFPGHQRNATVSLHCAKRKTILNAPRIATRL